MKKTDLFAVAVIAVIGTVIASVVCNMLLGDPNESSVTFKTIMPISSKLESPDPEIFNADAINPTVEVYVGSCIDEDRDGELSSAELVACNKELPFDYEEEEESEETEEDETQEDEEQ